MFPGRVGSAEEDTFPVDYVQRSLAFRVRQVAHVAESLVVEDHGDGDVWLQTGADLKDRGTERRGCEDDV